MSNFWEKFGYKVEKVDYKMISRAKNERKTGKNGGFWPVFGGKIAILSVSKKSFFVMILAVS